MSLQCSKEHHQTYSSKATQTSDNARQVNCARRNKNKKTHNNNKNKQQQRKTQQHTKYITGKH